jgi:hypothetical protein
VQHGTDLGDSRGYDIVVACKLAFMVHKVDKCTYLFAVFPFQLAPNQCQARLNWCNRELVKLMQLKMNAMLGGEELEDPEMITCQM